MDTLFAGATVFDGTAFRKRDIAVHKGRIIRVCENIPPSGFDLVLQFNDMLIVSGFADVHVHLREPGFSYKETIASATRAAARGGYTALCSMPNLRPAPDGPEGLRAQTEITERDALVSVYPLGTITKGRLGRELSDFEGLKKCGVTALTDDGSGVENSELMLEAMKRARELDMMIVAHCEDMSLTNGGCIHDGAFARSHGLRGIPSASEYKQLERDLELVAKTGFRYHMCHCSSRESVELIRQAKRSGLPVSAETAPHYLALSDGDLLDDGRFKMNPPIRSLEDRDALIDAVRDGTIDAIATDHAPHSAEEKAKGLEKSAMGIVGLEGAFSVLHTKLVLTGELPLETLLDALTTRPRAAFSLPGALKEGESADLAVIDLNSEYTIDPESFLSKGRATPFEGMRVRGEVVRTFVKGETVWQKQQF